MASRSPSSRQAHIIEPIIDYSTPDIRDIAFRILADSHDKRFNDPVYGSLYEGPGNKFPNHKLSLVTAADKQGEVWWYYIADRADQGVYNFSYSKPSGSQGGYPSYTRTYVIRRDDSANYLECPTGSFHLDTGGGTNSSPLNDDFIQVGAVNGRPSYESGSYTMYWNSTNSAWIIDVGILSPSDGYLSFSDVATPDLASNWRELLPPDTSTIVFTEIPTTGSDYLAPGSEDPDLVFNPEFCGFEFTGLKQLRVPDKELDSCYILVERRFEKLCALEGKRLNNTTGDCEDYTIEILPNDDPGLVCSPIDENGEGSTVTPINCDYSRKETSVHRPFDTRTYQTVINYGWPAVLKEFELMDWVKNDGNTRNYPRISWLRNAYNGPTLATITETWSKDAPIPPSIYSMQPTAVHYSCPFFEMHIPACLHPCIGVRCDIGSNDPIWAANSGSLRSSARTNFLDWPLTLTISAKVTPSSGGFILQEIVIDRPILGNGTEIGDPNYFEDYDEYILNFDDHDTCTVNATPPFD